MKTYILAIILFTTGASIASISYTAQSSEEAESADKKYADEIANAWIEAAQKAAEESDPEQLKADFIAEEKIKKAQEMNKLALIKALDDEAAHARKEQLKIRHGNAFGDAEDT